jgi:hypothetical protein
LFRERVNPVRHFEMQFIAHLRNKLEIDASERISISW